MKQVIDIENWERRNNYNFFRTFVNPTFSITSEVECGGAKKRAKERQESFFLHYLYAVLHAANQIKEFRYRNEGDQVVLYDKVDMLTPIQIGDNGRFAEVLIPYHANFDEFHRAARQIIKNIPQDAIAYGFVNENVLNEDVNNGFILLSALPDLYFTSITATQQFSHGNNFPLLNAGKAVMREGVLVMPIGMTLHHGFVDGFHISQFFKKVEEFLK